MEAVVVVCNPEPRCIPEGGKPVAVSRPILFISHQFLPSEHRVLLYTDNTITLAFIANNILGPKYIKVSLIVPSL